MKKTILFTGGGTAGHVFPALAVADELKKIWSGDIVWVGSKKGMEKRFVEEAGIPFVSIPAGKLRRYFSVRNFIDIFKILFGIIKSFTICAAYKPHLVFSKGGYVSVPLVFAAGRRRIPVITHESDTDPGLATRLNSRFAEKICVAFEETKKYFDSSAAEKVVVTGNPVRKEIAAGNRERGRELLGITEGRKCIFVLGGSQGAKQINNLITAVLPALEKRYFVLHQMGANLFNPQSSPSYKTFDFIGSEMPDFLAAADLVICRAGANTLAEISLLAKPAILIPLMGGAGRGDQVKNAALFLEHQAALVLEGPDATAENLTKAVVDILEDEQKRSGLAEKIRRMAHHQAASAVAGEIVSTLGSDA